MKKILLALVLSGGICGQGMAFDAYEVTRSTFYASSISVNSNAATLVSLTRSSMTSTADIYSVSLYNISSQSFVYTISRSSYSSDLTCANGIIVAAGTASAPTSVTEKFVGMYMWARACGLTAISDMRRALRGY